MFVAAMIAAAAVLDDPVQSVRRGWRRFPRAAGWPRRRSGTLDYCQSKHFSPERPEEPIAWLWQQFGHYHPVHTIKTPWLSC